MAVNTFRIYEDGYDSVDFVSDADISLSSWSPVVPSRRAGALGGRGPHNDVAEEMTISIRGTSASDTLNNLEDLGILLDRAERWARGEADVGPVLFQYEPDSGSEVLSTVIYGPPEPGQPMLELPPNFVQTPFIQFIDNITLRFRHSTPWLEPGEDATETASTGNNPGIIDTVYGTSATVPSPVKIALALDIDLDVGSSGLLLLAQHGTHIDIDEAENGVYDDGDWADAADTDASGGNVARYTPNDTNVGEFGLSVTLDSDLRRFAIVANLRNRSSTINYNVRGGAQGTYTKWNTIDTTNNNPQVVVLGTITTTAAVASVTIQVQADATGSSSNSLDFDTIAILSVGDDVGRIIALPDLNSVPTLTIDPAPLDSVSPKVLIAGVRGATYKGDAYTMAMGNTCVAVLIGNTGSEWRLRDDGGAAISIGMTTTRYKARLTPF